MFCQKCGENIQEDAKFCPKCDTYVSSEINKTASTPKETIQNHKRNAIWNPDAASNWSLLFSPAFGSYLLALNWRTLGEQNRFRFVMGWFYLSLVMLVVYIFMGAFIADEKEANTATRVVGFLYLIIWYFSVGRPQAKYVKEKFGKDYPRRGWTYPLLIGIGALVGYFFVSAAIYIAIEMMMT